MMTYGRAIADAERDGWLPERMAALDVIADLANTTHDPALHLAIRSKLRWSAQYAEQTIRDRVRAVLETLPGGFDQRLARVLRGDFQDVEAAIDVKRDLQAFAAEAAAVAEDYVARHADPNDAYEDLERRFASPVWQGSAHFFFEALTQYNVRYAATAIERALEVSANADLVAYLVRCPRHCRRGARCRCDGASTRSRDACWAEGALWCRQCPAVHRVDSHQQPIAAICVSVA